MNGNLKLKLKLSEHGFCVSPKSTNEVNTAYGVNTANTQISPASTKVSTASTQDSTATLSDATVYAFLASQPNRSQLVHEDLVQIHEDDLEEMDLKWQLALLSMRIRKFFYKTGRKITINGSDTAGCNKSKVECFCHKLGYFARDCRQPMNQDSRNKNQDGSRRTVNVEETTSNAKVAIDEAGISNAPMVKDRVSKNKNCSVESPVVVEKKTVVPTIAKVEVVRPKQQEQPVWKTVRLATITIEGKGCGCLRHMTGNMSYLFDIKEFDRGYVTFGRGAKRGKITGKGTLKTGKLDFEDVYFVKELRFNLLCVSQMCDKKKSVLFTDTGSFVLSPDFKLTNESQVLLKVPRKNNMYSIDIKNIVTKESLTCLVAKATLDESMLWHRRLGHINFKTINKLVKENHVRGLPTKRFKNDQTCAACLKGKQHKASYKSKIQNSITQPLFMLHMDLFGPTFVSSLMNKKYCLVVIDDYSRFTWVFILATKDETSGILKSFIIEIENLVDKKVKIIRCDNGTEFKNKVMSELCENKGIKKEFSVARTPQQNGVAKRRNMTLIEASKTMLADSKLPTNASNNEPQPSSDDEGVSKESRIDDQERLENIPSTPNTRIHKDHSLDHVIGDVQSGVQTRRMTKTTSEQGFISDVYEGKNHKDLHTYLFAYFLSQKEPNKVIQALKDPSWIEAIQEEILQFKLQQV
uniref:Putative ribonuclease H-like domain-containing protein n=1 Tax=Tanacetum cinerariifolium TaxID=118510 RepID=A0A6L2M2I6_TANCI|nr:putative ribonuclease H-like domain-containing protein [Tanacetum cinerariifolium]